MKYLLILGLIALAGCNKKNGDMAPIPNVTVTCLKTQAEACSSDSAIQARTVDVYWVEKATCEDFNDKQKWEAHGTALVECTSARCTATLKEWKSTSEILTELDEKTYSICAYIDTNDADVSPFTNGEPRAEETRDLKINATALELKTWTVLANQILAITDQRYLKFQVFVSQAECPKL